MALKWEDELYETECTGLDVAVTRTGMVSLTATFKPVEIDGTMVSRAYVHNFTIYKNLALGIGDKLMVYKANKIIPQIAENRTKSGELDYPQSPEGRSGSADARRTDESSPIDKIRRPLKMPEALCHLH